MFANGNPTFSKNVRKLSEDTPVDGIYSKITCFVKYEKLWYLDGLDIEPQRLSKESIAIAQEWMVECCCDFPLAWLGVPEKRAKRKWLPNPWIWWNNICCISFFFLWILIYFWRWGEPKIFVNGSPIILYYGTCVTAPFIDYKIEKYFFELTNLVGLFSFLLSSSKTPFCC